MKRPTELADTTEEKLRREIEYLKRQIQEQQNPGSSHAGRATRSSASRMNVMTRLRSIVCRS